MNRFTTGLIAGSIIGIASAGLVLGDNHMRKKVTKSGKKAIRHANDMIHDFT